MPPPKNVAHDEDDDLDDLDDVLDKFSTPLPNKPATTYSTSTASKPSAPTTTASTAPPPPHTVPADLQGLDNDDFANELAKGMEDLMREISSVPQEEGESTGAYADREKALKAAWEAMLVEELDAGDVNEQQNLTAASASTNSEASGTSAAETEFQKSIRQAMEKMQSGEQNLRSQDSVTGGAGSGEMDEYTKLLAALNSAGAGGGEGDDAELASFLESMMDQLMSKDILYEPLCELRDKFPEYLAKHASDTSAVPTAAEANKSSPADIPSEADMTRFRNQQRVVSQIIVLFNDPKYQDNGGGGEVAELKKKIVDLMGELQSYGSPPAEIMGPLPSGLGLGLPGLGGGEGGDDIPEGCCIS